MNDIKYFKNTENLKTKKSVKIINQIKSIKKVFLILTLGVILTSQLLGTETFAAHYKNDITPPWGRVYVEKSAKVDGTTYVGETPVSVRIYAKDDMCKDEEIKYYISAEPISNTTKLKTWYDYEEGKAHEINLNDNGTGKVYTIFKDANGNTSTTYEANVNTSQKVIFDINGGQGDIQGVEKERIYGMPYILPIQMPFKNGYEFLGWSTDKEATVGSYTQGDAIPADASLGTESEVTLYAIYGTNLDVFPDLINVVEIGDYVNYPVFYDNVNTYIDDKGVLYSQYKSKLNGWRVLNKNEETGEVTLVSAGVPLTLYKADTSTAATIASKLASTSLFINIPFSTGRVDGYFNANGFSIYNSLKEAFTNKYTKINSDIPEVRSMTKADVDNIYQYFGGVGTTTYNTALWDAKFRDMLMVPSTEASYSIYYVGTHCDKDILWYVTPYNGGVITGVTNEYVLGIRPVVTLKPNIKAVGKDINGAWDIAMKKAVAIPTVENKKYTGKEIELDLINLDNDLIEVTGTINATEIGSYKATISLKDPSAYMWIDGTSTSKDIEWKIEDIKIGDFIEYGIDYVDIYTNYEFSGEYAWRFLSKTENEDGTSNIEIISTGIPALVYYYQGTIDSFPWCASLEHRTKYSQNYYIVSSVNDANVKGSAGLMYDFDKIQFIKDFKYASVSDYDKGSYKSISGNQEEGLFKANNLSDKLISVRSVMHADLKPESAKKDIGNGYTYTDRAEGLFTLQNLPINPHNSGYYWLASPYPDNTLSIRIVQYNGNVYGNSDGGIGVRPVVSISNVSVVCEDNMWKIK